MYFIIFDKEGPMQPRSKNELPKYFRLKRDVPDVVGWRYILLNGRHNVHLSHMEKL